MKKNLQKGFFLHKKRRVKTLLIMKMILILNLVFIFAVQAEVLPQGKKISIKLSDATVRDVLSEVEAKSDYRFFYNDQLTDLNKVVDFKINNMDEFEALESLFKELSLTFQVLDNKLVVIIPKEISQEMTIKGKVTDGNGAPLPGVNILVKGTSTGTVTDLEGDYSITVPGEDAILVFSFIGYDPQEMPVKGKTTINVTLAEDVTALDDVVVIGYGTVKKSDLTGSVSRVKADELENITINSLQQGLQGRAAGVQVSQGSSMPGGGVSIRIRGSNSINSSNEPLYVIDGFPIMVNPEATPSGNEGNTVAVNPLANLNPGDIESMEILKDASATAIYGSRGANGVILITTKRAKEGTSLVQFEASYGVQKVARLYDVLEAKDFITMANEAAIAGESTLPFPDNKPYSDYPANTNTDWQKQIYRLAPIQQYQLTAQGSSKDTKYSITAGYFNQDGIVKESGFKRYSLRVNGDKKLGNKVQVSNSLLVSRTLNNRVATEGTNNQNAGPTNAAVLYRPTLPVYNADGSFVQNLHDGSLELREGGQENPLASIYEQDNLLTKDDILGNLSVQYEPIPNLTIKSSIGANISNARRDFYASRLTNEGGRGSNGKAVISRAGVQSYLNENTINYQNTFGDHRISVLAGYTNQKEVLSKDEMTNTQFPNDITKQDDIGTGTQAGGPSISSEKKDWAMASYLGRFNYVFKDKYMATFTYRTDGSSKFGKDNKWASFPSAAFAWRAIEEDFIKQFDVLSNLKVRASWGVTGNSEIQSYRSLARFSSMNYSFNGTEVSAFYPSSLANPDLKWETTTQSDIGIDLGFLDNRLSIEMDYYQKETKDGLMAVSIPSNSGFNTAIMNLAKVENKGFEMTVNAVPLTGDLKWNLSANYSMNKNEVTDINGLGPLFGTQISGDFRWGNASLIEEGQPLGVFYGYKNAGIFKDEADLASWEGGIFQDMAKPGDRKYYDTNGDGEFNAEDREVIGNPHPDFIIGLTNNFTYKDFTLSIFMQAIVGNDVLNVNRYQLYGDGTSLNKAQERFDNRWTPTNTNAEWPRFGANQLVDSNIESWMIEDGSFLRVRSIALGYNIPIENPKMVKKAHLQLSADNLLLFTKYSGYDPDVNTMLGSGNSSLGIDNGSYPNAKVFKLSLNVTF